MAWAARRGPGTELAAHREDPPPSRPALLEASQAQDAQVSTPLLGALHPPHGAPYPTTYPSEACVLVTTVSFHSRPTGRLTSSRPGKRGRGPACIGSGEDSWRSPVFPTPPPVPVGSRKEGRTQPVGRGPPPAIYSVHPSIHLWTEGAGWSGFLSMSMGGGILGLEVITQTENGSVTPEWRTWEAGSTLGTALAVVQGPS